MSKWIQFATPVEETVVESNEQFLSRRGTAMAGMIGSLSARLEIINMNLRFDMEYDAHMTADQWRRSVKQSRVEILETLISYQAAWSSMQNYQAGEVGKEMSDRKIKEYTTELEALKTLAL
jgi:glucan phosphorylase